MKIQPFNYPFHREDVDSVGEMNKSLDLLVNDADDVFSSSVLRSFFT